MMLSLSVEPPILCAWSIALLVALAMVREFAGGVFEACGAVIIFLGLLELLSPRHPAAALIVFGYCVCGVIMGLMVIDAAFDTIILTGKAPMLGVGREMSAREVAWVYYHTMLNSLAVNAAVTLCVGYLVLAALALGLRSEPRHRARWRMLVPLSIVGNGAYVVLIVPRYYQLRRESTFDAIFFDHWEVVGVARLVSLLAICTGMPIAFPIMCDLAISPVSQKKA
jgi:multisubunit Na+/H+ antiporter MnhB subunit